MQGISHLLMVIKSVASWRRLSLIAAVGGMVAACAPTSDSEFGGGVMRLFGTATNSDVSVLERTTEYSVIPASRALIHSPAAVLTMQRSLGGAIDQKIVLPNETALRGDNTIRVRAQTSSTARLGEFRFDEVVSRFGGLPSPFADLNENSMRSGRDALGAYVYASRQVGVDTNCVLVLRRLTSAARPMPRGTQALDVVMRNCVQGSTQQALAPLGERGLGVSGGTQGDVRMLSPHAAPRG